MKGIVVYYSATGSTAKTAKAIHSGMKELMDCDISSVKKCDPKDMSKYDVIAIGGPIWYFRETANLRLFIYKMPDLSGKYCIPFCSHGTSPTGFFWSMVPMLLKKGLTVIGYNDWYGSVYQVLHAPKPYFTDGHPDEIDLKEAKDFGRQMADRAIRIKAGESNLIPKLPRGKDADSLWRSIGAFMNFPKEGKDAAEKDKDPHMKPAERKIEMDKCKYPGCTLCIDNCPVNAIDFSGKEPIFKKSCLNCALCDKMCPEGAIDLDEETKKNKTHKIINMDKCDYPKCTVCVDNCMMNAIDFSVNPPEFKRSCEGDDLCWVVCPKGAIEITNLKETHMRMIPKKEEALNHPFTKILDEAEAAGRFRRLVPLDKIGWDNPVCLDKHLPRFVPDKED